MIASELQLMAKSHSSLPAASTNTETTRLGQSFLESKPLHNILTVVYNAFNVQ